MALPFCTIEESGLFFLMMKELTTNLCNHPYNVVKLKLLNLDCLWTCNKVGFVVVFEELYFLLSLFR